MVPHELVIGVDFGTTYSGVTWAICEPGGGTNRVEIISDWPGLNPLGTLHKVPTTVTYSTEGPASSVVSWGFEVTRGAAEFGRRRGSHQDETEPFSWFKLLLQPPKRSSEDPETEDSPELNKIRKLLEKYNKSAFQVSVDYLRKLWVHTKRHLSNRLGERFSDRYKVLVVLTVPAVWTPESIKMAERLAHQAGFPGRIHLLQEPEAAAIAAIRESGVGPFLGPNDIITVCDAGGGTCDLITYEVSVSRPLRVKEFVSADAGFCGSIYIDQAFEAHIEKRVGKTEYNKIDQRHKNRMLTDFETTIKWSFQAGHDRRKLLLVDLRGVGDNKEAGIEDSSIMLNPDTLTEIFAPTCERVVHLVEKQLSGVDRSLGKRGLEGRNVTALLVGGFGQSPFLLDTLQQALRNRNPKVAVLQATQGWTAVSRGATMWGIERSQATVEARKARYSYGVITMLPYDPSNQHHEDRFWDPVRAIERAHRIEWLVTKGDGIHLDTVRPTVVTRDIKIKFFDIGHRRFFDVLLYSEASPPPQRCCADVKTLGVLPWEVNYGKVRLEAKTWKAIFGGRATFKYILELQLESASMKLLAKHRGKEVGATDMPYGPNAEERPERLDAMPGLPFN